MKRHINKSQIFWGVVLLLLAAFLIVAKLGFLTGFNIWTALLTIFLVAVIIKSIYPLHFGGILFPLAILGIVYDEPLGITALTPWTLLIAAALLTGGLYMVFGSKLHHHDHNGNWQYDPQNGQWHTTFESKNETGDPNAAQNGQTQPSGDPRGDAGSYIYQKTSFGSATKYVTSVDFRKADLSCSFGAIEVYFDKAVIAGDSAEVHIDASFAGVELYVPHTWNVDNHISATLGGVNDDHAPNCPKDKTLVLTGSISFSGVEIHYI